MKKKKVIVLTGATASGKSSLALEIAKQQDACIINADCLQIYQGIPIITAQPSKDDLKKVRHLLYGFYPLDKEYSVGQYLKDLKTTLNNIFTEFDTAIIVGGTMMYIDAVVNGISVIPEVDNEISSQIREKYKNETTEKIFEDLQKLDKDYAGEIDNKNRQRMVRAIEVKTATGLSIRDFWDKKEPSILKDYIVEKKKIIIPRDFLYNNINHRFDKMVELGALEEAKKVADLKLKTIPKAIGLQELVDYVNGESSLEFAIEMAKQKTRNYAKRQMTWFRNRFQDFEIISN